MPRSSTLARRLLDAALARIVPRLVAIAHARADREATRPTRPVRTRRRGSRRKSG